MISDIQYCIYQPCNIYITVLLATAHTPHIHISIIYEMCEGVCVKTIHTCQHNKENITKGNEKNEKCNTMGKVMKSPYMGFILI